MAAPTVNDPKASRPTRGRASGCHVVVLGSDGAVRRALPPTGEVLIGRDEDADIRVVDPRASRHHARIILDDVITIEDLGSANGTRMRDHRLVPRKPVPFMGRLVERRPAVREPRLSRRQNDGEARQWCEHEQDS